MNPSSAIEEGPPKLSKMKTVLLFLAIIAGYVAAALIVMAMLNAWSDLRLGLLAVVIATLSPNAAWLGFRVALGKFRRGCEGTTSSFGLARGLDFGAIFGSMFAALFLAGSALGLPMIVIYLIALPLGNFIGGRVGLALRQWLLSKPKAIPLVVGGVSVWDRELDG